MDRQQTLSVSYLIRKLLIQGEDIISENHPWLWENDRWKELVFCLIVQITDAEQEYLRQVTDQLDNLGLINIDQLASLTGKDKPNIDDNPDADELINYLEENGFEKETVIKMVTTISETAFGLQQHSDGKIQHYLRKYGELLIKDIPKKFSYSALDKGSAQKAFVYWMQNVLNMPISLADEDMKQFAKIHGIKTGDLIEAADNMNINIALLDDLVKYYMDNHQESISN